jgi:monofunctional biosynthetic peptidoglycan transglycosylase
MKKILYLFLILLFSAAALYFFALPDVSALKKENPKKTSLMLLREAEWKAKGLKRTAYRVWVPYSRISPYLVKATIIAEDDKFWSHEGFDYEAIKKAIEKDIKTGKLRAGGSTISQQLAKNLFLTPEKSALRKLREAAITWKIERTLSKRRIIELYLNVVEWGDGIYGAEAASRHYFGKSALELTPMEAARLSVVLPNPRRLNAAGDQRYVAVRATVVYEIMVRRGIVLPELEEAEAEAGAGDGASATGIEAGPVEGSVTEAPSGVALPEAPVPVQDLMLEDRPKP